jgi:hypothetical protein
MQDRSLLAVKLELILFAKPDRVGRGGRKAASAVEAVANEDGFLQSLNRRDLQFVEGMPYQQSDLLNEGGWAHQREICVGGNGEAVGCIVPSSRASLRIQSPASKFNTLADTGRQAPGIAELGGPGRYKSRQRPILSKSIQIMEHDELEDIPPAFADMHVDEIEEVLEELGLRLSDNELRQLALFMKQSGSLEAALAALSELERKAA